MPIPAVAVSDLQLCAVLVTQNKAAQFRGKAALYGGNGLDLAQAQVSPLRFTSCSTLRTVDICNLQRVGHGPSQSGRSIDRASSEL